MTREKARDLLPVIQGFVEGKTIQYCGPGGWVNISNPDISFDGYSADYRIKLEPREFWLVRGRSGAIVSAYREPITNESGQEIIHVREVGLDT